MFIASTRSLSSSMVNMAAAIGSASSKAMPSAASARGLAPHLIRLHAPDGARQPVRCSLHWSGFEREGLILSCSPEREWLVSGGFLTYVNLLFLGKPIGGMRPAAPRAARHDVRSVSVRTRPLSPPRAQLSPSLR